MSASIAQRRLEQDIDNGFTLVELLVFSFFSVIILIIAGGILISSLNVERETRGLAETANLGQLVSRTVEEGARNASDIRAEPLTAAGQLLRARVAVGTTGGSVTWECQSWYYSAATTGFYWATSNTGSIPAPASESALHASPWLFLGDGLHPDDETGTFFGSDGSNVTLRFRVSSDDVDLVLIPNTVVKRQSATGGVGPATCF
jgi:type II secretory pathway pseudopilin PulG